MKTFTVKVPAGIRQGEKIRIIGQGKAGKNGGKNGDLFIQINIEKGERFKLEGCNLYTYLNLVYIHYLPLLLNLSIRKYVLQQTLIFL